MIARRGETTPSGVWHQQYTLNHVWSLNHDLCKCANEKWHFGKSVPLVAMNPVVHGHGYSDHIIETTLNQLLRKRTPLFLPKPIILYILETFIPGIIIDSPTYVIILTISANVSLEEQFGVCNNCKLTLTLSQKTFVDAHGAHRCMNGWFNIKWKFAIYSGGGIYKVIC